MRKHPTIPNKEGPRHLGEDTWQVIIPLNEQQRKSINALYDTGLHGNTPAEIVRRLMDEGLRNHTRKAL